jgi:large subunit ribosomal protein L21
MKYAIAQASGKQIFLKPGEWYDVDFLKNGKIGDFLYFKKLLFFRNEKRIQLGSPFLGKSEIPAKILNQGKCSKIVVLKTKPKKKYTRTRGHRQLYTRLQIDTFLN